MHPGKHILKAPLLFWTSFNSLTHHKHTMHRYNNESLNWLHSIRNNSRNTLLGIFTDAEYFDTASVSLLTIITTLVLIVARVRNDVALWVPGNREGGAFAGGFGYFFTWNKIIKILKQSYGNGVKFKVVFIVILF